MKISDNPLFGHLHIPNAMVTLQNVEIAIISLGMRGSELSAKGRKKFLLVGSSITLGRGVPENKTLRGQCHFCNSHLAVTLYHVVQGLIQGLTSLTPHYERVYAPDSPGFMGMEAAL